MPAELSTPAIVLRARDYAESDRIVTLLTRDHGKLGAIAKGAKNSRYRFERKLEPFSHVVAHFRRRSNSHLAFLTRAEAADLAQFAIEEDLGRIALGSYMLELCDALSADEGESSAAYALLAAALSALSRAAADAALRQAFELRILRWAGFGLEFARCRVCGEAPGAEAAAMYFVVSRGGVVCDRCRMAVPEGAIRMRPESAAALARLETGAIEAASGATPAGGDAAAAISRFIASIIDRRLRSAELLDAMLGASA